MRKQHNVWEDIFINIYRDSMMPVSRRVAYRLRNRAYYGVQHPIQIHINTLRGKLTSLYRWWSK